MPAEKTRIADTRAPVAAHPVLSQGLVYNGLVYTSGSLGMDAAGKLIEGDIKARTRQALENIKIILEAGGSSMAKVLRVTIFVTNIADVPALNEAYAEFFPDPKPVRSCVAVKELAMGTDVEIEATGYI